MKFRFTKRKECLVLTWPSRILILGTVFLLILLFLTNISYFLSKSEPVNGEFLIVDGLMPDYVIEDAIEIFNAGNYSKVITTGGKLPIGYYFSDLKTMAELSTATFIQLGLDSTKIITIPGELVLRDRTYTSALSVKNWLNNHQITNTQIDVLASGCHARRSKVLFQKALGNNFEVGVVSVEDQSYPLNRWWTTSKGSRIVISETIAFIYVSYFFE